MKGKSGLAGPSSSCPEPENDQPRSFLARYAYISQFTGEIVAFLLIGWWIDSYWQTMPLGIIVGAILGLPIAFFHLIRNVQSSAPPKGKR